MNLLRNSIETYFLNNISISEKEIFLKRIFKKKSSMYFLKKSAKFLDEFLKKSHRKSPVRNSDNIPGGIE